MNWNRETLKSDFSLANSWFKDNREKVFCIGLWLEMRSGYSTTTSRRKNTTLRPINRCHRPQHQHHGRTFMIHEDHALYLGLKGSCLLWAAKTWRFHYERSVSATIDSFEPLREKWPEYEQRHDKVILLHDNARSHVAKVVKKFGNAQMECFIAPAVFSRHCSFWLLIIPKDATRFGKSPVHFFRRNRKLAPKLDSLQRRIIFSRWNSKIAWKMGKSSRQR